MTDPYEKIKIGVVAVATMALVWTAYECHSKHSPNPKDKTEQTQTNHRKPSKSKTKYIKPAKHNHKDLESRTQGQVKTYENSPSYDRMHIGEVYMHDGVAIRFRGYGPKHDFDTTLLISYMDLNKDSYKPQLESMNLKIFREDNWKYVAKMSIDQFKDYAREHAVQKTASEKTNNNSEGYNSTRSEAIKRIQDLLKQEREEKKYDKRYY